MPAPLALTMILLPIVATLLGTVRSKVRPREKWGTCLMSANQIVDQIYKYRLRTDKYDTYKPHPIEIANPDNPPLTQLKRGMMARKEFVDTVSEIYKHAISTEVAKGGALKMSDFGLIRTHASEKGRNDFLKRLTDHVSHHFYGKPKASANGGGDGGGGLLSMRGPLRPLLMAIKNKSKRAAIAAAPKGMDVGGFGDAMGAMNAMGGMGALGEAMGMGEPEPVKEEAPPERDDLGAKKGGGIDDFFSQMPIESYVDCRARAFIKFLEKQAPRQSRRFNTCEGIGIMANTGGAVLAVLGYADWVAITVAIAGVAMAMTDYFFIPSQLGETNKALQDCHNMLIWFDSLSLVQRKKPKNALTVVTMIESSILNLCSAKTGVSTALPNEGQDEAE